MVLEIADFATSRILHIPDFDDLVHSRVASLAYRHRQRG